MKPDEKVQLAASIIITIIVGAAIVLVTKAFFAYILHHLFVVTVMVIGVIALGYFFLFRQE